MISLILKGGLGNQMFQYSAAYVLAEKLRTQLSLDLSFLRCRLPIKGLTKRDYDLDLFKISNSITTYIKVPFVTDYISYPCIRVLSVLSKNFYIEEDPYKYDSSFLNLGDGISIIGYFNNPLYFSDYEKEIKEIFDTDVLCDNRFKFIEKEIMKKNSVSVSIRRGDYINNVNKDLFYFLDGDYYREAVRRLKNKISNPHFYIFSPDSIDDLGSLLNLKNNEYTYLGKEYTGFKFKNYLRLISICKHNIISNSTFAFWGAYLNKNKEKIVITPKKWVVGFNDFNAPFGWITL